MFIDASALVAILASEEDAPELVRRLERATTRLTSPLAVWEATVALARILDRSPKHAEREINQLLALTQTKTVDLPGSIASAAIDAFERYGKGRHKAALNFGDCFAYACARHLDVPLLYKGADFALTDIEAA
jgi:ribonuclease VapC